MSIPTQQQTSEVANLQTTEDTGLQLKKGPWTAEEDEILIEHVRKYGEGRWSMVQKHTGLPRCGKSCRLRWANHLRPDLKKGAFTPEEERLILELQAKYGNKWARIATELPGRTDNEIKNYWNSRIKRRHRDIDQHYQDLSDSCQSTTPTNPGSQFQFHLDSTNPSPHSALGLIASSSAAFTSKRPAPLLSSLNGYKRHKSSTTNETSSPPLSPSGLKGYPNISTGTTSRTSLLSTTGSSSSQLPFSLNPSATPALSSLSQPISSPLSTPNYLPSGMQSSSQLSSLITPTTNSPILSRFSHPSSMLLLKMASSAGLSSLINQSSSSLRSLENLSHSLFHNQCQDLRQTGSFKFDGLPAKGSDHFLSHNSANLQNSGLPSNQLSQVNSDFTSHPNLTKKNNCGSLGEDPSQSDVILDLKMKAGWTRGLRRKTKSEPELCSKMDPDTTQAEGQTLRAQAESDMTFDLGHDLAAMLDASGLLEELLKESARLEFSSMGSEARTCLDSYKDKQSTERDNSNSLPSSEENGGQEVPENTAFTKEDFSELFCFDPPSSEAPLFYADNGQISNGQSSGATIDNSSSENMQQIPSEFLLANGTDHSTITEICSLDYLSGRC